MSKAELIKKLSQLESVNDQLYSELVYADELMRKIGFTHGLATVKETAREIYETGEFNLDSDSEDNYFEEAM